MAKITVHNGPSNAVLDDPELAELAEPELPEPERADASHSDLDPERVHEPAPEAEPEPFEWPAPSALKAEWEGALARRGVSTDWSDDPVGDGKPLTKEQIQQVARALDAGDLVLDDDGVPFDALSGELT
jgi:hypothetical protein